MFVTPNFELLHDVQIDTDLGDYNSMNNFHDKLERLRKAAEAVFGKGRILTKKEQRLLKRIREKIFEEIDVKS